ncbi:MAG: CBS domain-containing protein [Pseudomonadota bacterium]
MHITQLMSRLPTLVYADETLDAIGHFYQQHRFEFLLVVDREDRLLGVLNNHDILNALNVDTEGSRERQQQLEQLTAEQLLSQPPVLVSRDSSAMAAIGLFEQQSIACLPVVDHDDRPVGVITWRDAIFALGRMLGYRRAA